MANHIQIISLKSVPMEGPVTVTRAEVTTAFPTPLARVRYARNGEEQEKGLLFDLDKRAFIDHLENDEQAEQNLSNAVPHIARILESARSYQLVGWVNNPGAQDNLPKPEDFEYDK